MNRFLEFLLVWINWMHSLLSKVWAAEALTSAFFCQWLTPQTSTTINYWFFFFLVREGGITKDIPCNKSWSGAVLGKGSLDMLTFHGCTNPWRLFPAHLQVCSQHVPTQEPPPLPEVFSGLGLGISEGLMKGAVVNTGFCLKPPVVELKFISENRDFL